jgi:endonuclease III
MKKAVIEAPSEEVRAKAQQVYELLIPLHGERDRIPRREPLHELVSTMLSHRTTEAQEEAAFQNMWKRFGSWKAIEQAPFEELAESIHGVNWPEAKAANIQKVLKQIADEGQHKERGVVSIDFLDALSAEDALAWLVALPGVGLKTATLVLLFCFGKAVLPVDTHLHRVSGRLGLIGPKVSAEAAHWLLLAMFPPDARVLYNFHINMLRHGQKICVWKAPRCAKCPLAEICDYFQTHHT